jgi:hypothetical protein
MADADRIAFVILGWLDKWRAGDSWRIGLPGHWEWYPTRKLGLALEVQQNLYDLFVYRAAGLLGSLFEKCVQRGRHVS